MNFKIYHSISFLFFRLERCFILEIVKFLFIYWSFPLKIFQWQLLLSTNVFIKGWTGEKICMVGDSAGGNLIMSVNLRLIELDVKRKPDGLVLLYTPFLFQVAFCC